jgi:hypothetical protein
MAHNVHVMRELICPRAMLSRARPCTRPTLPAQALGRRAAASARGGDLHGLRRSPPRQHHPSVYLLRRQRRSRPRKRKMNLTNMELYGSRV